MKIAHQVQLKSLNTLALPCEAFSLISIEAADEVATVVDHYQLTPLNTLVLGGGSNLVLPTQLDKNLISLELSQIRFTALKESKWQVKAEAGVVWDELVDLCVSKGLRGIENLSLIPGRVGAAPIQNIGAYGVELKDVLIELEVFDLLEKSYKTLTLAECEFAYRDSVFKRSQGRYIILSVTLALSEDKPFSLDYGPLQALRANDGLSVADVREKVIEIRRTKIPDPSDIPNAGSFFKNPYVSVEQHAILLEKFPTLVSYPIDRQHVKLAAGWLIDNAGWKGFRNECVGVHDQQALVLVNHNTAVQKDILCLANEIKNSVFERFGVSLEIEPQVL